MDDTMRKPCSDVSNPENKNMSTEGKTCEFLTRDGTEGYTV